MKVRNASVCIGLLALVGSMCVSSAGSASDSTIPCNSPPSSGASVAVHRGTQVSTTQDRQKNTCTFSINGAVATSPPPHLVLEALNTFRDPQARYLIDRSLAVNSISALAAAGAPVNEVPRQLVSIVERAGQQLELCLDAVFRRQAAEFQPLEAANFRCQALPVYSDDQSKRAMLERTGVAVSSPTLAVSIDWGDGRFRSVVYLPALMRGLPPLR